MSNALQADAPIPFIDPLFPDPKDLAEDIKQITVNNYYSNNGPFYYKFKAAAEAYLGQNLHVSILANATQGLLLAMKLLMKPQRKYVLVPSFTFAAGPLAILWAGFEPLFIDVRKDDIQPDIRQAASILETERDTIAGILMCNTFGIGAAAIGEWEALAQKHDVPLVIDSASGFGSVYTDGAKLGGRGDCEVFSLHATKPLGIGEGCIVSSRNPEIIQRLEQAKNFGFDETKNTTIMGTNAKIEEFSCAIGVRLLTMLDENIARRRQNLELYRKYLAPAGFTFVKHDSGAAVQFVTVLVPVPAQRQRIMDALEKDHIQAKAYYTPPIHQHDLFKHMRCLELGGTAYVTERVLSLPASPKLSEQDITRICKIIVSAK